MRWEYNIGSCSRLDVIKYCINDYPWQQFRLTLKGRTTVYKLQQLEKWLKQHNFDEASKVQVDNYIGALKRGGQLSAYGEVVR